MSLNFQDHIHVKVMSHLLSVPCLIFQHSVNSSVDAIWGILRNVWKHIITCSWHRKDKTSNQRIPYLRVFVIFFLAGLPEVKLSIIIKIYKKHRYSIVICKLDDIRSGCVCFHFCRGAAQHCWVCQKRAENDLKRQSVTEPELMSSPINYPAYIWQLNKIFSIFQSSKAQKVRYVNISWKNRNKNWNPSS